MHAVGTHGVDRGQEEQLDHHGAFTLTGRATAACDIEGEPTGLVSACPSFQRRGEPAPHMIEESCVGRDVGAGRAADGFLVDAHHTPDGREIALDRPSEFIGLVSEEQASASALSSSTRGASPCLAPMRQAGLD